MQELLFRKLVTAFHNPNGDIQNATRAALQRLHVCSFLSTIIISCWVIFSLLGLLAIHGDFLDIVDCYCIMMTFS